MSNSIPISGLNLRTSITSSDFIPIVVSSSLTTYRIQVDSFQNYLNNSGSLPRAAVSASWASRSFWATTSSFSSQSFTSVSSSWASRSFSATTASFSSASNSSSYAKSSSWSDRAGWAPTGLADTAVSASWASQSLSATSASWASRSFSATTASWASQSFSATTASFSSRSFSAASASWASSSLTASYLDANSPYPKVVAMVSFNGIITVPSVLYVYGIVGVSRIGVGRYAITSSLPIFSGNNWGATSTCESLGISPPAPSIWSYTGGKVSDYIIRINTSYTTGPADSQKVTVIVYR